MPLPKPKLPAGWRRAKLIALINELYLSFRGCGTCGVVVNALALSTNPQAGPLRYSLAFHLRRSKKPNSEPKLRPPAVSKSLTRSRKRIRTPGPTCGCGSLWANGTEITRVRERCSRIRQWTPIGFEWHEAVGERRC